MPSMKKTNNFKITTSLCVISIILSNVSAVKVQSKSYNELFENMFIPQSEFMQLMMPNNPMNMFQAQPPLMAPTAAIAPGQMQFLAAPQFQPGQQVQNMQQMQMLQTQLNALQPLLNTPVQAAQLPLASRTAKPVSLAQTFNSATIESEKFIHPYQAANLTQNIEPNTQSQIQTSSQLSTKQMSQQKVQKPTAGAIDLDLDLSSQSKKVESEKAIVVKENEDQESDEIASFTEEIKTTTLAEDKKGFAGKVSHLKLKKAVPVKKEQKTKPKDEEKKAESQEKKNDEIVKKDQAVTPKNQKDDKKTANIAKKSAKSADQSKSKDKATKVLETAIKEVGPQDQQKEVSVNKTEIITKQKLTDEPITKDDKKSKIEKQQSSKNVKKLVNTSKEQIKKDKQEKQKQENISKPRLEDDFVDDRPVDTEKSQLETDNMQQSQKFYEDQQKVISGRVKELEKQIASEEKKNKQLKKQRKQMEEADNQVQSLHQKLAAGETSTENEDDESIQGQIIISKNKAKIANLKAEQALLETKIIKAKLGQDFKLSETESSGLLKKEDKDESGSGTIKNKIIDVISKAEKEVDNESSPTKLFKGEEVGAKNIKASSKTDLSHRRRRSIDNYDDQEDDLDRDLDRPMSEEKVIRKANDAIRKNQQSNRILQDLKHNVQDSGSISNSYDDSIRGHFAEDRRGRRRSERSRDRDYDDDRDSRDSRESRDERDSRDERWERDHEYDEGLDNVHEIVRDVLHSNRGGRIMGPLDDLRQGLGNSWLEIQRFFSGTSGYHRACKFINFMKMLEAQN